VELIFDSHKLATNKAKHHFDFTDLTWEWFESAEITPAKLGRLRATGEFRGVIIAVFFRPLGREAISIISMRHASKKERDERD
jgi:uncharacterized DUF497 family protein